VYGKRFLKPEKTLVAHVHRADIEEKLFRLRLNVIDTPGFGDFVNNDKSWLAVIDFIDSQYESVMRQEQQPHRTSKFDMRVHVCLYFIRPTGHKLKPLDVQVMKQVGSRCNLIPVIGKADTLSRADLDKFKERVRAQIRENDIQVFELVDEEGLEKELVERNEKMRKAMPFGIVGSEVDVKLKDGRLVKGREYPWGIVEVENEEHCDFVLLRDLLIRTHMLDLTTSTEEIHYDNYRARFLAGQIGPKSSQLAARFKDEEDSLRKKFTEQVKMEENRFRQWESKLIAERDRLNKDLENEHAYVKALEMELEQYQMGKYKR